jgi:hypothetical protein
MKKALVVAVASMALSAPAWAQDFQVGSRAKGMGGSYTAFEDDPVSIWLNPAGIARQDFRATIQYQTFTQYELQRTNTFIGTKGEPEAGLSDPPLIPSFAGIIAPLGDKTKHAFAFALVRPFENRLTYSFPAPPAFVAQTEQQFWRFRFAYAYDFKLGDESTFFPHISLGLAGDVGFTQYSFRSFSNTGIVIDDIHDTNTRPGFGAGLLTSIFDDRESFRVDFGVAYQSGINFSFGEDDATFAPWDWPAMTNAGVTVYAFGQALKVTLDAQWISWARAVKKSQIAGVPSFTNSLNYSFGAEYEIPVSASTWVLPRLGYRLYDSPWNDKNNLPASALTQLSIDTKASKFNIFTLGVGFRWKNDAGRFRGFDIGAEFGGDVRNYSIGYIYDF